MAETPQQAAERRTLGVGLSHPLRQSPSGYIQTSSGSQLVRESIEQLLNTDPSERPYQVRNNVPYGTRVRRALFEDPETVAMIANAEIPRAIRVWEPRVTLLGCVVTEVTGQSMKGVSIDVRYRINTTGGVENQVVMITKEAQP